MERRGNQGKRAAADTVLMDGTFEVLQSLKALSSMIAAVPKENIILQSIFFSSMNLREMSMDSAEDGTFEWIYKEETERSSDDEDEMNGHPNEVSDEARSSLSNPDAVEDVSHETTNTDDNRLQDRGSRPPFLDSNETAPETGSLRELHRDRNDEIRQEELSKRATARDNFTTWLRSGAGVFHISGKAGSGKSTLMKFLCSHERTQKELRVWAGEGRKLVFARFYFWKSSKDNLQMSLPGLHRSILFETLKHCPNLIPVLFRRQWEVLSNGIPYIAGDFVSDSDVQNAFKALTTKGSFPKRRFCFFVDGLDEYHGQMQYQLKLARDLQRWASGDDVKICATSRPYIQFDKLVTSDDRMIHLHDLTRHDINLFSRKMVEDNLKDDLERVESYYLRLIEKVVEKSEGVFLWARLVVCSLLEGLFRHDREDVLEQKLEIMPPDINGLYTELLGTLSLDDRVRAEKMLLLTAHSPEWPRLSSVVYAFLDELSNPNFPPRDGKKPTSWRSTKETAEDVRLQLRSLTKGLLETTSMVDYRRRTENGERMVQFFHRTVRDFVLEHSKIEDTAGRFPWITKGETYYRLWLAEMILADLPYRREVWLGDLIANDYRFRLELPPDLLESFSCTLMDEDAGSVNTPRDKTIRGIKCAINSWCTVDGLSFINLAAFCGQRDYVLQQTTKSPELLRGCGDFHILLSAALGNKKDLVRDLLKRGSSPLDCVDCQLSEDSIPAHDSEKISIPLWILFTIFLVGFVFELAKVRNEVQWEVLELLLQDPQVDASNSLFIVCKGYETSASHFITLRQVVEDLRPQNANRLLALLERENGNSYGNGARRFLSRFIPLFKQTDSVVEKETSGYTRLQINSGKGSWSYGSWRYGLGIFSDLRLEVPYARVY